MKNFLEATIRSALRLHTVSSLVADVERKVEQLRAHSARLASKAGALYQKSRDLEVQADDHSDEAERADRIATKLAALTE